MRVKEATEKNISRVIGHYEQAQIGGRIALTEYPGLVILYGVNAAATAMATS